MVNRRTLLQGQLIGQSSPTSPIPWISKKLHQSDYALSQLCNRSHSMSRNQAVVGIPLMTSCLLCRCFATLTDGPNVKPGCCLLDCSSVSLSPVLRAQYLSVWYTPGRLICSCRFSTVICRLSQGPMTRAIILISIAGFFFGGVIFVCDVQCLAYSRISSLWVMFIFAAI